MFFFSTSDTRMFRLKEIITIAFTWSPNLNKFSKFKWRACEFFYSCLSADFKSYLKKSWITLTADHHHHTHKHIKYFKSQNYLKFDGIFGEVLWLSLLYIRLKFLRKMCVWFFFCCFCLFIRVMWALDSTRHILQILLTGIFLTWILGGLTH